LQDLRSQFQGVHYFRLPGLLEPTLLRLIQHQIEDARFGERVHDGIDSNKELCMAENAAIRALLFLMNDEKFFEFIQFVTRCEHIRCFDGRVYRVNPNSGHHDSWHNDLGEDRLVGLTINLSPVAYSGGVLQIRERESQTVVSEVENLREGDAVVFRLRNDLQHRITDIEGATAKTAFAGWFMSQPDFSSLLKRDYGTGRKLVGAFPEWPKTRVNN
jgi:hypothetical protein